MGRIEFDVIARLTRFSLIGAPGLENEVNRAPIDWPRCVPFAVIVDYAGGFQKLPQPAFCRCRWTAVSEWLMFAYFVMCRRCYDEHARAANPCRLWLGQGHGL